MHGGIAECYLRWKQPIYTLFNICKFSNIFDWTLFLAIANEYGFTEIRCIGNLIYLKYIYNISTLSNIILSYVYKMIIIYIQLTNPITNVLFIYNCMLFLRLLFLSCKYVGPPLRSCKEVSTSKSFSHFLLLKLFALHLVYLLCLWVCLFCHCNLLVMKMCMKLAVVQLQPR